MRYKVLFIALMMVFSRMAAAEPLQKFTSDLLESIKTVDDLKKNSKKIRIRTQAEVQYIQNISDESKLDISPVLDLLYLSSLLNAAEGMNRTEHVLQQWNEFLKVNQKAKINLESRQIGQFIKKVQRNSKVQLTFIIPGYFESMPNEVYFALQPEAMLRHCATLLFLSQTESSLQCLNKIERHFLDQGKREFLDEAQLQKLQLFLITHDIQNIQNFLNSKTKAEDKQDRIVQIYGASLDFLQERPEEALKKVQEIGEKVKEGKLKFILAILKAEIYALQKKYSLGIEFIEKVFKLRKEKKEFGKDSEQRLRFILASLYIGEKKSDKAIEILLTLETFPKSINLMQSILIDSYKCGLWSHLKKKEASNCLEMANNYSKHLQSFKGTDPYTLTAIDLMRIWGKPERDAADQAKLQEHKGKIIKQHNAANPLALILSL